MFSYLNPFRLTCQRLSSGHPIHRSYAIKHIYVGPAAADFTDIDLCLNLFFTLMGFVPGGYGKKGLRRTSWRERGMPADRQHMATVERGSDLGGGSEVGE